ncbi:hypothetical protein EJB05_10846, partial [Eragrostis curvula]
MRLILWESLGDALTIYLINDFSGDVGPLLIDAIDSGTLRDLDLIIMDEKDPPDCNDEEMLQKAQDVNGFFNACPSVLVCLTKLSLYNVCFGQLNIHHVVFDFCKQLKHLALFHCDAGYRSIWKIDAPLSKLGILELYTCCLEKLEVVCLPKLEKLHWDTWRSHYSPLSFGFVPSLRKLNLGKLWLHVRKSGVKSQNEKSNGKIRIRVQSEDKNIIVPFLKVWMHREIRQLRTAFNKIRQLRTAFNKIRKLYVHGIFVEFDLLWTIAFLEAAPSVELLHIQVWEHRCDVDDEARQRTFKRIIPSWELELVGSKNLLLTELQLSRAGASSQSEEWFSKRTLNHARGAMLSVSAHLGVPRRGSFSQRISTSKMQ